MNRTVKRPRHYTQALYFVNWQDIILKNKTLRNDSFCFEIKEWIEENLNMDYITIADAGIYMYSDENMILFKLRWL